MLVAFRALQEPNGSGTVRWGLDQFKALEGILREALAKTIGDLRGVLLLDDEGILRGWMNRIPEQTTFDVE